jgi:hypothetical protein
MVSEISLKKTVSLASPHEIDEVILNEHIPIRLDYRFY